MNSQPEHGRSTYRWSPWPSSGQHATINGHAKTNDQTKPRARIRGQHYKNQRHSVHVRNDQRDEYGVTRDASQQPRPSPKAKSVTRINLRTTRPIARPQSPPGEIALGCCCQIQLTAGPEEFLRPAVPAVVLIEKMIMAATLPIVGHYQTFF